MPDDDFEARVKAERREILWRADALRGKPLSPLAADILRAADRQAAARNPPQVPSNVVVLADRRNELIR